MKSQDWGCILLILGTTVGGAMLALPVVTAYESFAVTVGVLIFAWALMSMGAWALMRVNSVMPLGSNLLSMARATTGRTGYLLTWVAYLALLYSLISAYLAGSSDVFRALLEAMHVNISRPVATVSVTLILAFIVYRGISSVDWVNRGLMGFKLIALLVLMTLIFKKTTVTNLLENPHQLPHWSTVMVVLCAFGFAIILPSIRVYLGGDQKRLNRIFYIACLLPLLIYLTWIACIQAAVPRFGTNGLIGINNSANTVSALMGHLVALTQSSWTHALGRAFISVCALTAFLGVSMCLFDFLKDGIGKIFIGKSRFRLALCTYLPPLLVVLINPRLFTEALAYAGALCVLLLIILPFVMYYRAQKRAWKLSDSDS